MNNHSRQFNVWMGYDQGIGLAPIASIFGMLLAKELSTKKQMDEL